MMAAGKEKQRENILNKQNKNDQISMAVDVTCTCDYGEFVLHLLQGIPQSSCFLEALSPQYMTKSLF
jgi:hypothetical protein